MTDLPPSRYPALTWTARLFILALVVAQFLFAHGPVWRTRFNWNAAIAYSYASIPVLVGVALALKKQLRPLPWFLHTLELSGMKFVITAGTLLALLTTQSAQSVPLAAATVEALAQATSLVKAPPRPAIFAKGGVRGRVTDPAGRPVEGALVFLAGHVEDFGYPAAPAGAARIQNDGRGFWPTLSAARWGQPVELRSSDRRLHTALVVPRGVASKANLPLLADGSTAALRLPGFEGVAEIRCTVHGASEASGYLGVFSHPFFTFTDASGEFSLAAVPVGATTVRAFHPGAGEVGLRVDVTPGAAIGVELRPGS